MWFTYTMEYHSAIKSEDIISFAGKWMELENFISSRVTQSQKDMHGMYSLISGYQPKKHRIPRKQPTGLKKVNKPKDPSEYASIPLEREKKAVTGSRVRVELRWESGQGGKWQKNRTTLINVGLFPPLFLFPIPKVICAFFPLGSICKERSSWLTGVLSALQKLQFIKEIVLRWVGKKEQGGCWVAFQGKN